MKDTVLSIRDMPAGFMKKLRILAAEEGVTLRDYCLARLDPPVLMSTMIGKERSNDASREDQSSAVRSEEVSGHRGGVDVVSKTGKPAVRKSALRSVAKVESGPDKGVGTDAEALNDGMPADADVPSHVWPTYGGLTRSGDPTTPTIAGYYPPSDAGNLTVEMLASVAKVRGPRTPAKLETDPFKIAANRVKIKKAKEHALSVKKSTAWFMNEKCPHGWMNSAVCEKNDGGCVR